MVALLRLLIDMMILSRAIGNMGRRVGHLPHVVRPWTVY